MSNITLIITGRSTARQTSSIQAEIDALWQYIVQHTNVSDSIIDRRLEYERAENRAINIARREYERAVNRSEREQRRIATFLQYNSRINDAKESQQQEWQEDWESEEELPEWQEDWESDDEESKDSISCTICCKNYPKNYKLRICRHCKQGLCQQCHTKTTNCPFCRKRR